MLLPVKRICQYFHPDCRPIITFYYNSCASARRNVVLAIDVLCQYYSPDCRPIRTFDCNSCACARIENAVKSRAYLIAVKLRGYFERTVFGVPRVGWGQTKGLLLALMMLLVAATAFGILYWQQPKDGNRRHCSD